MSLTGHVPIVHPAMQLCRGMSENSKNTHPPYSCHATSVAWTILSKHLEAPCGLDNPVQAPRGFRGLDNPVQAPRGFRGLDNPVQAPRGFRGLDNPVQAPRGSLWLGQSCPSTAQHGQDCPCYAAPCGLDNPVQALPDTDKTVRATRLPVAWTVLSKHCPTRTRLSVLRGSLWLGQSCPSARLHRQDCPCYEFVNTLTA
ncbi:MAG: hypothetical protein KatS3mg019_2287 [Fimbriimonadales bacterium]|nr:MAG: hypothetical protein KatS3mg019_2287 [Fimbriimonadales bacterium]